MVANVETGEQQDDEVCVITEGAIDKSTVVVMEMSELFVELYEESVVEASR